MRLAFFLFFFCIMIDVCYGMGFAQYSLVLYSRLSLDMHGQTNVTDVSEGLFQSNGAPRQMCEKCELSHGRRRTQQRS